MYRNGHRKHCTLKSQYSVQGIHEFGVVLWYQGLGGDGGHAKSTRGIPSSVIKKDCGDDGSARNEQRVRVAPGG